MAIQFELPPSGILIGWGERYLPAVFLVDTSNSMENNAIDTLNQELIEFGNALRNGPLLMGCADVCIISFNSTAQTVMDFRPVSEYEAPLLTASLGMASINEAIEAGLDVLEARTRECRINGACYYRPVLFLLTSSASVDTGKEEATKARLRNLIKNRKVRYIPVTTLKAGIELLRGYYPEEASSRPVIYGDVSGFKDMFTWFAEILSLQMHPLHDGAMEFPPLPDSYKIIP